jgi:hypothetical protein
MTISNHHINIESLLAAGLSGGLEQRGFPANHVCLGIGGRKALRRVGVSFDHQKGPRPDLWVIDGKQPYAIEVGQTDPDKWGRAVPVVHVTFLGAIAIYDARSTPFERALIEAIRDLVELNQVLDEEYEEDRQAALAEGCDECGAAPGTACKDTCGDDWLSDVPYKPKAVKKKKKKRGPKPKKRAKKARRRSRKAGPRNPRRGEACAGAKLTEAIVRDIRRRWANGETNGMIALALGLDRSTVSRVAHRRGWRHVEHLQ